MRTYPVAETSRTATVALDAIAVNVMCHPSRLPMARELADAIGPGARIVLDPAPEEPANAVRCAAEAWSAVDAGKSHVLVIQDDMTLAPDFLARLADALDAHPDEVLALFGNWSNHTSGAARLAALNGYSWLAWRAAYVPVPALVMPVRLALDFSAYLRACADREVGDADLLRDFLLERGRHALLAIPSLAEHDVRGADSVLGSLLRKGVRRSVCFAGDIPSDAPDAEPAMHRRAVFEAREAPFVSHEDFIAYVHVRDPMSADGPGTDRLALDWLADRVVDLVEIDARWAVTTALVPTRLRELLRPERLQQAWLHAVCLGVLADELPPGGRLSAVATAALASTLPGVYRRVFADPLLGRLARLSLPMLRAGVLAGRELVG